MTIRHLRLFIAVAETGKMSAAAARFFISQPTVSQAIKELEEHYGVLLFERLLKKLYITEAGKQLLAYARVAVRQFDELDKHMFDVGHTENLRIGATITVGSCLLPALLNRFAAARPGVETFACMNNTKAIEEQLLEAKLDLGLVEGRVQSADLVNVPMVQDCLVLVCAPDHRLAGRKRVAVKDLERETFAMRETGSGTRELFEQYLQASGVTVKIGWEATCPEVIKKAVLENNCLAVMSARLVAEEVKTGRMYAIRNKEQAWDRRFNIVYYKNKYLSGAMQAFMALVRELDAGDVLHGVATGMLMSDGRGAPGLD